jgi:hypothetical protein
MQTRILVRGGLFALMALIILTALVRAPFFASAQGVRVQYGETVEGSIANAGEADTWTFEGLRGDVVSVRVSRTEGDLVPAVALTDSDQTVLIDLSWPQEGPPVVVFTITLRTSGVHTLVIRGDDDTTGSYALSLELQQAGEETIQDGVLVYGRAAPGEITDEVFRQVWTFRGTQNDIIDIVMTVTSGNLNGYLTLITPENNVLASVDAGGDSEQDAALFALRLPSTGIYSLIARRAGPNSGSGGTTQGTYELALTLRASGSGEGEPTPVALVLGNSMRGRLTVDAPSTLFSTEAQGVLALSLDLTDASQVGTVAVMTPQRALLGVFSGISPLRASVVLPQPGPVLIAVSAEGLHADATTDFVLMVSPLATATGPSRALQYGKTRAVSGGTGQPDAWYFFGRAGDLVEVNLTPFAPILEGEFRVFSPSGALVVERPVRNNVTQPLTLAETGQHEIFVGSVNVTYEIGVERHGMSGLDFGQRLVPGVRGMLLPGTANAVSGELSPGGSDAWVVDMAEAQTWSFGLAQTGSDTPVALAVEAPNGERLDTAVTSRISNSAEIQIQIPYAGRYRVVVFDPTGNASHTYTLSGQPAEGGVVLPGVPVKGVLFDGQPYDKWKLSVLPGSAVDVQVRPVTAGELPVVNIAGPDGLITASSRWREQTGDIKLAGITIVEGGQLQIVVARAPNAGRVVYYLTVDVSVPFDETAFDLASTALVPEVFVTEATPPPTDKRVSVAELVSVPMPIEFDSLPPVDFETLVRGEILPERSYEARSFSAYAGQMIEFSVIAVGESSGPDIILLDPNGGILAERYCSDTKANTLTYRFADSSRYTIVVKLDQGGRYTLWMQSLPDIDESVPVVLPGQAITYGATVTGETTQPGEQPLYVFYGHTGDVVTARVRRIYGDWQPRLALVAANGDSLAASDPGADPSVVELSRYSLPADGLYQLHVGRTDETGATGYFALYLGLEQSGVRGEFTGGLLEHEQIAALGLSSGLAQRWLFSGRSGEVITVRAEPLTAGAPTPLTLQLADSAGNSFVQRESRLGQGALVLEDVLLPRTGVYQVIVAGGQREAGFYRVSLERDTVQDQPVMRYGETSGQVLTRENFLDVWTFAGSRGDVVTLSARPVRGDAALISMQLRAQNSEVLTTAAGGAPAGARVERVVLPVDGFYSILVGNLDSDFEGETAYELTLRLADSAAHSAGTVVSVGQTVEGTFYVDDPADTWLFEGKPGDIVVVNASGLFPGLLPSLSLFSTDWRIASQSGQADVLASAQAVDNDPARIELVVPSGGPYALLVSDPLLVGGNYRLELTGQTISPFAPDLVRPGQTRGGQIGAPDLLDAWVFEGGAGDTVTIDVKPESRSYLAPEVMLLAPDGGTLVQANAGAGEAVQVGTYALPVGGTYTIVVTRARGIEGHTEGRYTLDLQQSAADISAVLPTSYGRFERGALDAAKPAERWRFTGTRGDVVHVYAEATSGDLDPIVRLYDSGGHLLAEADDEQGLDAGLYAELPQDGSYIIDVLRYGGVAGTTEGFYALGVELAYHAETIIPERLLVYGDRVSGSTDSQSRSALWTFAGEQGDTVYIKIQYPLDDSPLTLFMRDPAENILATGERDRGDSVIEGFVLPYSGYYVLEVRRPEDAKAIHSPYTLEVSLAGAPAGLRQASGGTLVLGQAVTGQFSAASETHTWVFHGEAGNTVVLWLNLLNSLSTLDVALLAPDGTPLASADTVRGTSGVFSTAPVTLPADGVYTLLVTGSEGAPGTPYRLSLLPVEPDGASVPTLAFLHDVFGTISDVRFVERWQFEAQAGETLFIRLAATSGDLEPVLMLWDPDGRPLMAGVRDKIASGIQFGLSATAPSSGTYQVVVGREGGQAGRTSGSYRLMLRRKQITSQAARAADVAFDQPVFDFMNSAVPKHYAFQGLAGDVVAVAVQAEEGSAAPSLSLELEDGTTAGISIFMSAGETGIPAFVLPEDGRYIVTLTSEETVSYSFVVSRRIREVPSGDAARELGRGRNLGAEVVDPTRPTYWTFDGGAGEVLVFTVDTSNSRLRADVTLYGARGYVANAVQAGESRVTTLGPVRLPEDGEYLLVVGAWPGMAGDSTGRYAVRVDSADPGVSGSEGGQVVKGQVVSGGLIPGDAQDIWTFTGKAGEVVDILAEQTRGDDSLALELIASDETVLAVSQPGVAYLGAEIRFATLPETGIYRVVVRGELNGLEDTSIEYRLSLFQNQSPMVASLGTAQGIVYGETQSGTLISGAEYQSWAFFGRSGERIRVEITPDGPSLTPALYLLGPGGYVVCAETGALAGVPLLMSGVVLPDDGFYGLVVGGSLADPAMEGHYTILLEHMAAGAQWQGTLEGQAEARWTLSAPVHEWTLSPVYAGDYVVQVVSPGVRPNLLIMSADGGVQGTGSADGQGRVAAAVRMEQGRSYAVIVSGDPAVTAQSRYVVTVLPASVTTSGGDLMSGETNVGRINQDHLADEWRVTGRAGQLTVGVRRTSGNLLPSVSVFNENGILIAQAAADDGGAVDVVVQLPGEGRYSVVVSQQDGSRTAGDYAVAVEIS